ncbi:E3 ubiquitin ligase TRAF3IP2 [Gastrophryne carolinensis]
MSDSLDGPRTLQSDIGHEEQMNFSFNRQMPQDRRFIRCGPCIRSPMQQPRMFQPQLHPNWGGPQQGFVTPLHASPYNLRSYGGYTCHQSPQIQASPFPLNHHTGELVTGLRASDLPPEQRGVFITYSQDAAHLVIKLANLLCANGFEAKVDIFEGSIRGMDITSWIESHFSDMGVMIIIAISPQYKKDVEGIVGDKDEHGLHTRYIHRMMQTEFIKQGSLNYRFLPVLFENTTLDDVPNWLRNTNIYHWPKDSRRLFLRLLRQEEYIRSPIGELPVLQLKSL